tara:strand:- start:208 stop:459 length:252 start_codon:yes stop_codon:yes gene_type:complete
MCGGQTSEGIRTRSNRPCRRILAEFTGRQLSYDSGAPTAVGFTQCTERLGDQYLGMLDTNGMTAGKTHGNCHMVFAIWRIRMR